MLLLGALAFVPYGIVLVRVRVAFGHGHSKLNTHAPKYTSALIVYARSFVPGASVPSGANGKLALEIIGVDVCRDFSSRKTGTWPKMAQPAAVRAT